MCDHKVWMALQSWHNLLSLSLSRNPFFVVFVLFVFTSAVLLAFPFFSQSPLAVEHWNSSLDSHSFIVSLPCFCFSIFLQVSWPLNCKCCWSNLVNPLFIFFLPSTLVEIYGWNGNFSKEFLAAFLKIFNHVWSADSNETKSIHIICTYYYLFYIVYKIIIL